MLTVKHIKPSGCESIHLAREVRYDCGQGEGSIASAPTVWIDTPTGDTQGLGSDGTFYVMNGEGRTVAKYHLGGFSGPVLPGAPDRFPLQSHPGYCQGVAGLGAGTADRLG